MIFLRARPATSSVTAATARLRPSGTARAPRFQVHWEGAFSGWVDSLKTLSAKVPRLSLRHSVALFRDTPVAPFRFSSWPLTASLFLHFIAILFLPFLLSLPPGRDIASVAAYSEPPKIYYRLTTRDPFANLPRIAPVGLGGRPGAGSESAKLPVLGSTAPHRQIIVISKPVRPDNHRQTIYQPASPPDLKITMDLKLPNLIGGTTAAIPKPQIHFNANSAKPLQRHNEIAKAMAPALNSGSVAPMNLPNPTVSHPHLAVPIDPNGSRPNQWQGVIAATTAPSLASANTATLMGLSDLGGSQVNGP